MSFLRQLSIIVAATSAFVAPLAAQEVWVYGDSEGQGYVFRHDGVCWLTTVAHVLDADFGSFELMMPGLPPLSGRGEAAAPFWEGLDLAIGVVRGNAAQACTADFDTINQAWTRATATGQLRLPSVLADGTVNQAVMRVIDLPDHKRFLAEFTDGTKARTGRSGAFLSSSGKLAGMVVDKPTTDSTGQAVSNTHGFIRIEEIAMNLSRYLKTRGASVIEDAKPVVSVQASGYAVSIDSSTLEPVGRSMSAENVLIDGSPFLFSGTGTIVLRVTDNTIQELRGVRILSEGEDIKPKSVTINIDSNEEGSMAPNWFWSGVMDPVEGLLDTGLRAARTFRRVAITISSAWGGDPRRIDRIILY